MKKEGKSKLPKNVYAPITVDKKGNTTLEYEGNKKVDTEKLPAGVYDPFTSDSKGNVTREKTYKSGGKVSRGDGCAQKGKTKGTMR